MFQHMYVSLKIASPRIAAGVVGLSLALSLSLAMGSLDLVLEGKRNTIAVGKT